LFPSTSLTGGIEIGRINGFSRHLRSRIFTTHKPSRLRLCEDDKKKLMDAIFIPAVKNRLRDLVEILRLGLNRDHWAIVQSINTSSWDNNIKKRVRAATSKIVSNYTGKRLDGYSVTNSWIRNVVRKKLLNIEITIGDSVVKLIQEGPILNSQKTIKFSLDGIVEAMITFYNLPVSPSRLHKVFLQIITERSW